MPENSAPLGLESLETRQLLSAAYPTAMEQYVVELINRARANPGAEAARYGIDLNEGLRTGTISDTARQPVAVNPNLTDSARKHSQWMIDHDTFSHTGAGGSDPGDRMAAGGYAFNAPWTWGENIALRSYKTGAPHPDVYEAIERDLFVDVGIDDRGHRVNLLAAQSSEIGVGAANGQYSYFPAAMVTQDFASSGDNTFLTGVVFTDAVKKDNFYTPGEGLGGVTIMAVRLSDNTTFKTQTWSAGGYSLKLAPGAYKVTASGGGLSKAVTYNNVTVGQDNVKRDFTAAGAATPIPAPTPTPTPKPTPSPKPTPQPPKATVDKTAPKATVAHAPRKREVSRYYRFAVTYTDNTAVSITSVGNGDILVKGAGGYARTAKFVSIDNHSNGATRTATYEVKGPKGIFNRSHNGTYTIWVVGNQVKDAAGNAAAATQIGSFKVRIAKGVSASAVAPKLDVEKKKATPAAKDLLA